MNFGTYDINIDFSKLFVHNNTSIYFKEGDLNTAKVRARLTMKNKPINIAGCNVTIRIEPTEGNTITDNATVIDPINGIIEVDFKSNALLEGTHLFEVWIIKDESIKKSGKIGYRVLDSIEDAGSIEGTNEYPILISLISDANKAIQDAKEALNIAKDMEANVNEAIGNTNIAISNAETATSNANSKITELDESKTEMIEKVDASIDTMKSDVNKAKEDMKLTTDAKVKEIDTAITNMNSSVEDAKSDMQATTDAKMQQVDNSIANMKIETNNAINNVTTKTDEKIADVDRALAAGTVDLELKKARKDANGVVHDTLEQRLESDLIVGDKSLKDFVVDMNGMKETQDLAYETNAGYKVCNDTQVGVVKDLKICGKSLVNIADFSKVVPQGGATKGTNGKINFPVINASFYYEGDVFGQLCTAIFIPDNNEKYTIHTISKNTSNIDTWYNQVGIQIKVLNNSEIYKVRCYSNSPVANSIQCYIVRGDVSQNPPNYFEGIASVGNTNGLEAVTRKEDGNIFDLNKIDDTVGETPCKWYASGNKICIDNITKDYETSAFYYVKVEKGKTYTVMADNLNCGVLLYHGKVRGHDATAHIWSLTSNYKGKTIVPTTDYITVRVSVETYKGNLFVEGLMFNLGNQKPYEPFKGDKKAILFKDTDGQWKPVTELRGIDLNIRDTIEKGKYNVKTNVKMLNGSDSENWKKYISTNEVNTIAFTLPMIGHADTWLNNNVICDLFNSINHKIYDQDIEGIALDNNGIIVKILRNKLVTQDVNGFKKWLQSNSVNLIYPLRQYVEYEVNPLELESFDNITLWLILSGVIAPPASFKITSSLPNFVKNVDTRVKRMENDFYKYTVTQNRMQLGTTYSSDRTTFRVDTATFSTEKAKQDLDYDLFRLLKHNILVGPKNYDKSEMENMMDFYVSVGKIDYNMWDELYMLIEEQYNPPVEEEAPVI